MTSPRRALLTAIDFTSSRRPHTRPQTLLTKAATDTRLLSADSSLHILSCALLSGLHILWEKSCPPPPAHHSHPPTTPSALRKVPYKGVGNVALALHHHINNTHPKKDKKNKKRNTRCKFRSWTASPTSEFSRNSLHVEFGEFFRIALFNWKHEKGFSEKPFMVVHKDEG